MLIIFLVFAIGFGLVFVDHRLWWKRIVISFGTAFFIQESYKIIDGLYHINGDSYVFFAKTLLPILFLVDAYKKIRAEQKKDSLEKFDCIFNRTRNAHWLWGWGLMITAFCFFIMMPSVIALHYYQEASDSRTTESLIEAAEKGDVEAQKDLAARYRDGIRIARDFSSYYMWLYIAAAEKDVDSQQVLRESEGYMSRMKKDQVEALQEGRKRADMWLANRQKK